MRGSGRAAEWFMARPPFFVVDRHGGDGRRHFCLTAAAGGTGGCALSQPIRFLPLCAARHCSARYSGSMFRHRPPRTRCPSFHALRSVRPDGRPAIRGRDIRSFPFAVGDVFFAPSLCIVYTYCFALRYGTGCVSGKDGDGFSDGQKDEGPRGSGFVQGGHPLPARRGGTAGPVREGGAREASGLPV